MDQFTHMVVSDAGAHMIGTVPHLSHEARAARSCVDYRGLI